MPNIPLNLDAPLPLPHPGELTLFTLPPSHFSEKARWGLDRAQIPYREQSNPPLFHRLVNFWLGAKKTRPVLRTPSRLICDSTEILQYVDGFLTADFKLYPADSQLRQQICEFEQHLGKQVGFSVIRWAYFHFLPETKLIVPLMSGPAKSLENRLFRVLFPLIRVLMQKGLKLIPATAERAQKNIEAAMDEVAERLSDGRQYLFGDRFSAADLTCAALFGPIFVAPEYGGTRADVAKLPTAVRERREAWLKHPTGQFVLRLYREHRNPQ
jgi:glutathione S-transferase